MWGGVFFAEKRGWVGEENAFFEFFLREASTAPPPARPIYPRGGDPSPQRTRNGYTAQAAAQTAPNARQTTPRTDTHTPGRWTRCTGLHSIPDRPRRVDRNGGGRWRAGNTSIMRIMIALSQAWYIDSNINKYHKDILLFLVIVNYYLSIDIPSY
jgi:hypothetical protein